MAEPPHDVRSRISAAQPASDATRRTRRRLVFVILAKLGVVALLLALPAVLAISLGAAHAVILLPILVASAAGLVLRWRRGHIGPGPSHRSLHRQ
jgi:hypothetical protein